MLQEVRTSTGPITRVHADRREREADYVMPSHHCHPYYELSYIEKGACRFLVEDGMYDLVEGVFLLIPPQTLHYTRYLLGACRRCGVYFRMEDLDDEIVSRLPGGTEFFSQMCILKTPSDARRRIGELIAAMGDEELRPDESSPLLLRRQLQGLLLLCARSCTLERRGPAEIRTADRQVLLAARFINEHFRQQITAADIAAAAGFSPNYLSRKFREAAGIGVHDYLVFVRLREAALELVTTRESVTEIALRCGFSDSNYFKDAFKKKYGMTPREYRREH